VDEAVSEDFSESYPEPGQLWARYDDEWCVLVLGTTRVHVTPMLAALVLWDRDNQWPVGAVRPVSAGYLHRHAERIA
jgi:hypothetical protein